MYVCICMYTYIHIGLRVCICMYMYMYVYLNVYKLGIYSVNNNSIVHPPSVFDLFVSFSCFFHYNNFYIYLHIDSGDYIKNKIFKKK